MADFWLSDAVESSANIPKNSELIDGKRNSEPAKDVTQYVIPKTKIPNLIN